MVDFPVNFREKELKAIFSQIAQGQSFSLVGVGTVGKTRLIEHFARKGEVQDYMLRQSGHPALSHKDLFVVVVDPNGLVILEPRIRENLSIPAAWAGFELIFRHLIQAAQRNFKSTELPQKLADQYNALHERETMGQVMAMPYLERAIKMILDTLGENGKVVLILDEFQRFIEQMPDHFFLNLRAMRDKYRYQLTYITVGRMDVTDMIDPADKEKLEPFYEIFRRPVYIGPYDPQDVNTMYDTMLSERNLPANSLSDNVRVRIWEISSAFTGLVRTLLDMRSKFEGVIGAREAAMIALENDKIIEECQIMLGSFPTAEREALKMIASREGVSIREAGVPREILANLVAKSVLTERNSHYYVSPLLFALVLKQMSSGNTTEPPPPRPTKLPK